MMRSCWLESTSSGTSLSIRTVDVPNVGARQLLVRMHAAGLNRGELIARKDLHGSAGVTRPAGNEGSGEVVSIGKDVTAFKVGDRVMGVCGGAFSEYCVMDDATTMHVPARLSWEEAACTSLTFLVVYDMLVEQGHIASGDWLLVAGVSSGVGVAALQSAKALGAKVIGTSRSPKKLEQLKQLGLDFGISSSEPDLASKVREITGGHGVDVAINAVGGTVFGECLKALAFEGRLATVGYIDGVSNADFNLALLHAQRLVIFGVSALQRRPEQRAKTVEGFSRDILPFLANGQIRPQIDRVFAFDDLPAAKLYMESNAHVGKIAIKIA